MHQSWELDAVPLGLAPEEWEHRAAALAQLVQVLNALVTDVYGLRGCFVLQEPGVYSHKEASPCHVCVAFCSTWEWC